MIKMDLIFDVSGLASGDDEYGTSKKDVLRFLKDIGVDTRFISYTPQKIYINNLRFSKFSRKRQQTFENQYSEMEVVRNSLFQKICSKSSKILSAQLKPNSRILINDDIYIVNILLEPYTRKYGVQLVCSGEYDFVVNPIILDDEVNNIFEGIFNGDGINFTRKENEVYPLINISLDWINSFLKMDNQKLIEKKNNSIIANSFSKFLDEVAPQYKENVLKAKDFIELKTKQ